MVCDDKCETTTTIFNFSPAILKKMKRAFSCRLRIDMPIRIACSKSWVRVCWTTLGPDTTPLYSLMDKPAPENPSLLSVGKLMPISSSLVNVEGFTFR